MMKLRKAGLALSASLALIMGMASSVLAIEAFQERFEWGDLSKPTKLRGRVAVVDPYEKAAWLDIAVFGGNAESGYYWQKAFPGKNLKVYPANDQVWQKLKSLGKTEHCQAVMPSCQASKYTLVEFTVQEVEQNHRVVLDIKELPEIAGTPDNPRSIHSLRAISILDAIDNNSWQQNKKMMYDVMIPGQHGIAGFIPNSNQTPHKSKGTMSGEFGTLIR